MIIFHHLRSRGMAALKYVLCGFPLLLLVTAHAQSNTIENLFQQGAQAMHAGHPAEAEKLFRQATTLAPRMPEAHLDLALALGGQGKLAAATQSIQTALQLDPKLPGAHMFLGIFYHQMNRQDDARAALQMEINQAPKNAEALVWLGMVELATGNPEKAVGPLDRAAELNPDDLNMLEARGRAHNLVARDSYAQMARLDPGSWHVHRVQGEIYANEGKHQDAIAEYAEAIRLEPRNPDLYDALGDEYRKTSQLELAEKTYARELELGPNNAVAMYNLGSVQIEREEFQQGVTQLQAMIKFYERAPVAQYYLGRGLAALGRDEEAIQALEQSAHADNAGEVASRSYYELSRLYRRMQRTDDSRKSLAEYTRLKESSDKASAQQVEDWRKLNVSRTPPKAN